MSVFEDEPTVPELQQQAIDWLVLLRSDILDEADMYAFADWLSRDHRHPEAFAAAEDLLSNMIIAAGSVKNNLVGLNVTGQATADGRPNINPLVKPNRRRASWIGVSLALVTSWLFAVILVMPQQSDLLSSYLSDYHTKTGEFQDVELSDGSRLLLNTNSAVSVNFTDDFRQITLHQGQVRFTVAKDQNRPFEVIIDDMSVRALGTMFEVSSLEAGESTVIVQEHAVSARIQHAKIDQVKVEQGQRLLHRSGTALQPPEPVALEQAIAWQNHQLMINDRPLGELIAELNRYRPGRIFLASTDLQQLRISGVFSLEHPDNTLNTVQTVLGLKQTRLGNWWVVLHR